MKDIKKLMSYINRYEQYSRLYDILYENPDGITSRELIETYGFNKRVHIRLNKFEEMGVINKTTSKKGKTKYKLTDKYKLKSINHIQFLYNIQQNEIPILFGDTGELARKGLFGRRFMNNHTIYGFPKIYDEKKDEYIINDYELEILLGLLQRLDDNFELLKEFKIIYELRKKTEKGKLLSKIKHPYGIISEKLLLHNIIFWYSKALYEILEQDTPNKNSYEFICDLYQETCKLAKKHELQLSYPEYPEKEFVYNTPFFISLLFASNPKQAIKYEEELYKTANHPYQKYLDDFTLIKEKDWFYNKNKIKTLEQIEKKSQNHHLRRLTDKTPLIKDYETKTGKKFYKNSIDIYDSIATISTNSIIESTEYKKNIGYRLDYFFKDFIKNNKHENFKNTKHNYDKVFYMNFIIRTVLKKPNNYDISKFKRDKRINKYFNRRETELMIHTSKQRTKKWKNKNESERYLWFKLYEENGPWYDKYIDSYANEIIEKNLPTWDENIKLINKYNKRPTMKNKKDGLEYCVDARLYFKIKKDKNLSKKLDEDIFDILFK